MPVHPTFFGGDNSTAGKLLATIVGPIKYPHLLPAHKNLFASAMLLYVMQVRNMNETKAMLKPLGFDGAQNKVFSRAVSDIYELNLALRQIFLIGLARQQAGERSDIDRLLVKADLPPEDAELFRALRQLRLRGILVNKLATAKEVPLLMPKQVMDNCGRFIMGLRQTHFFEASTRRKLFFVAKSNNWPLSDFYSDLEEKAVKVYYRATPFYTPLHRENRVRASVGNYVEHLIKHFTATKRARMHQDSNGEFYNVIRTLAASNLQPLIEEDGDGIERDDLMYQSALAAGTINQETDLIDAVVTMEKYVRAGTPGRRLLVDLLILQPNPRFVAQVKLYTRLRAIETPEDVFYKLGQDKYFDLVAQFLGVPRLTVRRVAEELRTLIFGRMT